MPFLFLFENTIRYRIPANTVLSLWERHRTGCEAAGEAFGLGMARLAGLSLDTGGDGNAQYRPVDVPPLRKNFVCVLLGLLLAGCGSLLFPNVSSSFPSYPYADVFFDKETASCCVAFVLRPGERASVWRPAEQGRVFRVEKRTAHLGPRPERGYVGNPSVLLSGVETPRPSSRACSVWFMAETLPPSPPPVASCPRSPPV